MEDREIQEFEALLKEFRLRAPRLPLPTGPRVERGPWRRLAIAAMLVILAGAAMWVVGERLSTRQTVRVGTVSVVPGPRKMEVLTAGYLNQKLRSEPGAVDELLLQASSQVLPEVERSRGVLHALSRE
jgi:hypothetical protein